MSEPTHAYVAYLACGHAIEMAVDLPEFKLKFFRLRYPKKQIRRIPLEEARATPIYVKDCLTCRSVVLDK